MRLRAVNAELGRLWAEMISYSVVGLLTHCCGGERINPPSVEQIQDVVEEVLIKADHYKIAKAYILYHQQRQKARDAQRMMLDSEKLMEDYLQVMDWRVSENSNLNYSLQGLNFYLALAIASQYWLNKIYPPEVREAHTSGALHLHDQGSLSIYCCGWDLLDLLLQGFCGVAAEEHSAQAFANCVGAVGELFSMHRGTNQRGLWLFLTLTRCWLAPFVHYDRLKYSHVKQVIQEFVFNMNVPPWLGFQMPFSNITLDLVVPDVFHDQPVVIGGEYQESTYGKYQEEMNLINRAFVEVLLAGDAKGREFTFPILVYNLGHGFDWESDLLEPIWAMAGKYGIPYFANFINSEMNHDDARLMCCCLCLDNRKLRKRMGCIFAFTALTGSIGVVTLNLPHIAYATRDETDFQKELPRLMEVSRVSLEIKRKSLEQFMNQKLYPYSSHYLHPVKIRTGRYWSNHFSTISLIGMHEACQMVIGAGIAEPEGKTFAERMMDFMLQELNRSSSKQAICATSKQRQPRELLTAQRTPTRRIFDRLLPLAARKHLTTPIPLNSRWILLIISLPFWIIKIRSRRAIPAERLCTSFGENRSTIGDRCVAWCAASLKTTACRILRFPPPSAFVRCTGTFPASISTVRTNTAQKCSPSTALPLNFRNISKGDSNGNSSQNTNLEACSSGSKNPLRGLFTHRWLPALCAELEYRQKGEFKNRKPFFVNKTEQRRRSKVGYAPLRWISQRNCFDRILGRLLLLLPDVSQCGAGVAIKYLRRHPHTGGIGLSLTAQGQNHRVGGQRRRAVSFGGAARIFAADARFGRPDHAGHLLVYAGVLTGLLHENLVDWVAMNIKALLAKYDCLAGMTVVDLDCINASIALLSGSGLPHEFRTTVVSNWVTLENIVAIANWLEGSRLYGLQQFRAQGCLNPAFNQKSPYPRQLLIQMQTIASQKIEQALPRGI